MTRLDWASCMTLISVMSGLAAAGILTVWMNGSIFAGARARLEGWRDLGVWPRSLIGEFLTCPLCLSVWIAMTFNVIVMTMVGSEGLPEHIRVSPIWRLAVSIFSGFFIQFVCYQAYRTLNGGDP